SILLLIDKGDNENAGKMIVALSRFFRISISRGKNIIPVTSELDHVNYYLKIQKMRFKDNFAYELNYDKNEIAPYFVMKLILQPIVENAIVHGIGEHPKENA
ncbi:MAG TPA: sensor histidine kinase, partial [Firmicutes bacterium]|nr:sensor histidine kinase [Bacillota bacterium]